ncbi:flagellar biosynthesis protein FlhF [Fuchsiella alkaliacetigena]|uniref:flagellar biosynthesis protein FlhF n=1 Tax=Fuchsiella alkaliacetigena TaxID=957042 RepID=UPI00200A2735|nr:flagellar biosynthesis protein FlhF [Fuchsiella alkaliacetigena]MCK8823532.1 flagellar biosynthesis protein FlhF [Fuchsiella alkaliacetigena]
MEVKRYRGESMQEAMFKVKADLGPEAIILHRRKLKKGGFMGFFGKKMVEIVATVEDEKKENNSEEYLKLQDELAQMKDMMSNVLQELETKSLSGSYQNLPPSLQEVADKLLAKGVKNKLATDILTSLTKKADPYQLEESEEVKSLLVKEIEQRLSPVAPLQLNNTSKVVALIGPTGVGKTTTIAKLAAKFNLMEQKEVALVTADTYRIAAVEQLKTYSEIIGVPLEVVFTPSDLVKAIERFADKDLVLIDTAGRSQQNKMQMSELTALMENAEIDETYLVLSATTKLADLRDVVLKFKSVDIDKFIFTKLDETNALGTILNITEEFEIPLSYISNGQNVPEDIKVVDPKQIADNFLKE